MAWIWDDLGVSIIFGQTAPDNQMVPVQYQYRTWRYFGLGALAYKPGYRTGWTSSGGDFRTSKKQGGIPSNPKYTLKFDGYLSR